MWCRPLKRSQACCQQTQPAHAVCTATTMQKQMLNRLDSSKLKQDSKRQAFINDISSPLDALKHSSDNQDENWIVFRDTVHSAAMDSLGPMFGKHQNWFDESVEEIQGLIDKEHQKQRHTSVILAQCLVGLPIQTCNTVQKTLRDMQDCLVFCSHKRYEVF